MPATGALSPVAFDSQFPFRPRDITSGRSFLDEEGNKKHMHTEFNPTETTLHQGTVFKKNTGSYLVQSDDRVYTCAISNKLRKELIYPIADPSSLAHRVVAVDDIRTVDPVAIGDQVLFMDGGEQTGMIKEILPRRNKLTRQAAGRKQLEQIIVSNVDQVVPIMAAARPEPKWNLLDRFLATAEFAGIPALIVITKMDLAREADIRSELEYYQRIGYPVLLTSAATGTGIEELHNAFTGNLSVLIGKSGVGKSSLLNALQPGLGLRVSEVGQGEVGKGRHTTTNLEMFALDGGGSVVDTPGMREFKIGVELGADLALLYPDLRPFVGYCKFGLDCSHRHEPGCAVLDALEAGEVSPRRYQSYLGLQREVA
jgi:ribosome biogenesis GTPase / thiamine phosphate phosphatase